MTSSNPEIETAYERWEIGALSKDFKTKSEASSYKSKLHQEMMLVLFLICLVHLKMLI